MPTKTTKKSSVKINKSVSRTKTKTSLSLEKKDSSKKVVVKRRKLDLTPTRASAVAIALQANRAKKQALIEKVANSNIFPSEAVPSSDTKIPLWVWLFFWCSLLLFCVSFYHAIIRPQIEKANDVEVETMDWVESISMEDNSQDIEDITDVNSDVENIDYTEVENINQTEVGNGWDKVGTSAEVIEEFFGCLSSRDFDGAFDLMIPALRNYDDIRTHFTSLRMNPFLDWIEWWKLLPENMRYINSPTYWKDVYNFDLSYVLKSNQEKYEETWEFGVNTSWDEPKISSIRCISSKCSYHPIFWPENFGLTR